jgi:hypothetical protein
MGIDLVRAQDAVDEKIARRLVAGGPLAGSK